MVCVMPAMRWLPLADRITSTRRNTMILLLLFLATPSPAAPEDRAIAYLSREVPAWSKEHKCFSCHNNGDAARALYTAARLGLKVPKEALDDTTRWLAKPEEWDKN